MPTVPETRWVDNLRELVLGGVGTVPIVGSAASAVVAVLWRSGYEKRVQAFLTIVASELNKLSNEVDNLPELLQRELAVSVGLAAAAAAGKTHDHKKLEYLAAAVVGVTRDVKWDAKADFALLLLQLVDDLTVTHVHVLATMGEQEDWKQRLADKFGNDAQALTYEMAASMFPERDPVALQGILSDLTAKNLMANATTWFGVTHPSPDGPTELGKALLKFIGESS